MPSPSSYVISNMKGWLVKLAPILHISLCILKVALTAYGIPLPIPHLVGSALSPFETSLHFVDESALVLSEYVKEKANEAIQDAIDDIDESLSALAQESPSNTVIRRHSKRLQEATAAQAEEFHHLLFSLEKVNGETYARDWLPNHTGLVRSVSDKDGSTAWVSPEGLEKFQLEGQSAFK
jgi:hypothetical protein